MERSIRGSPTISQDVSFHRGERSNGRGKFHRPEIHSGAKFRAWLLSKNDNLRTKQEIVTRASAGRCGCNPLMQQSFVS